MHRLNLREIESTLAQTRADWKIIEQCLIEHGLGKKDVAFDESVMQCMLVAYDLLDHFLEKDIDIFAWKEVDRICKLNECVHYGNDTRLRREFTTAIVANREKFASKIPPIHAWYQANKGSSSPGKVAAKIFVSILGEPQLFIEGNHRTGSLVASWINVRAGKPPFVLSPENALGFFDPSAKIKQFSSRSFWRGRSKLPKYHKVFKEFWMEQSASGGRFLK